MSKTVLVIGATGLVGKELVQLLSADTFCGQLKVFVRRELPLEFSRKIKQVIVNFDHPEIINEEIKGDVVFCAMGTTIKAAGSKEAFVKVDYTYVLNFAELAKRNGVKRFILVSSLGVSDRGNNFYLTVKRDIELALARLNFDSLIIVRPSMLLGKRSESRPGESIGKFLMQAFSFIFRGKLKKYRAIKASTVAKAMITLSKSDLQGVSVFESNRLQELGK
jgi:uncharacterized protein YbjT (DUF2867 family)